MCSFFDLIFAVLIEFVGRRGMRNLGNSANRWDLHRLKLKTCIRCPEIDALLFPTFIWWRHPNKLSVSTFGHVSSPHGRDMHLPTKFGTNTSIQVGAIDIFRNPTWRSPPSCIFETWIWHSGTLIVWCLFDLCYYCLVQISVMSLRSTHLCRRRSFDVMWIDFRFRLLVMWSSANGRDASFHRSWWKKLYQTGVVDILPKFKMAAILDLQVMWIWLIPALMLVVRCLNSVPNLVQIGLSVVVSEIDALLVPTFIWWRHAN